MATAPAGKFDGGLFASQRSAIGKGAETRLGPISSKAVAAPIRAATLILSIYFALFTSAQSIVIQDPALEQAIRNSLGKPAGALTAADMDSLTSLATGPATITSLEGIQAAHHLKFLFVYEGQIPNLDPLAGLTTLTNVDLGYNAPTNLDGLTGLTNLLHLSLSLGQNTPASLPAGLRGLVNLRLESVGSRSVVIPPDMLALEEFNCSDNLTTNIVFPSNLETLRKCVATHLPLVNIQLPLTMPRIAYLFLDYTTLGSLTLPSGMSNLIRLQIQSTTITNLSLQSGLASLEDLDADLSQLAELKLPEDLTNLKVISASENHLTNVKIPPSLTNLNGLGLSYNQITNIDLPSTLVGLTAIDLTGNKLPSLSIPQSFHLTVLYINNNPLKFLSSPAGIQFTNPGMYFWEDAGAQLVLFPVLKKNLGLDKNHVTFQVYGNKGTYKILQSTDLVHWSDAGAQDIAITDFPTTFIVPAMDPSAGFYQVQKP